MRFKSPRFPLLRPPPFLVGHVSDPYRKTRRSTGVFLLIDPFSSIPETTPAEKKKFGNRRLWRNGDFVTTRCPLLLSEAALGVFFLGPALLGFALPTSAAVEGLKEVEEEGEGERGALIDQGPTF